MAHILVRTTVLVAAQLEGHIPWRMIVQEEVRMGVQSHARTTVQEEVQMERNTLEQMSVVVEVQEEPCTADLSPGPGEEVLAEEHTVVTMTLPVEDQMGEHTAAKTTDQAVAQTETHNPPEAASYPSPGEVPEAAHSH